MELRYYQTVAGQRPFVEWFAGDKRDQAGDIKDARRYFKDFKERTGEGARGS